ncbi:DUF1707 SHOCT-like domain-containing protein [Mycolicibacterium komossense]|uniref:DUF1707 domain-containing protein n=1 Tax=Mycolicibacterium komossense TaxID=1779 RepID=A0ABT3C5J9_9MYCO|nr:DUF1707 domain-containing protein [Mycolicibacterium komossense]MCV7224734.1 DUF1707 domain-containing protein [Mycolicibacterium komossense]
MATRQTAATRAKDSDRNDTCTVLDSALADGQLSMEEHRQRVATATTAATLGDLQNLVADLQNDNAPVQLPDLKAPSPVSVASSANRAGLGLRVAVAVVLVVLGIGIGWGLYGNTSSPLSFATDPGAKPDGVAPVVLTAPRQLQSLGGMTGLIEQMKQRFGDTMGYQLLVYPDFGSLDRADAGDNRRKISYNYRGGWGDSDGTDPISDGDRLVDFSTMDLKALVGVLRGAPETLGIKRADVKNTYMIIGPSKDPSAGDVSVTMYVSSDFGSGYLETNGDGVVKRVIYPS